MSHDNENDKTPQQPAPQPAKDEKPKVDKAALNARQAEKDHQLNTKQTVSK